MTLNYSNLQHISSEQDSEGGEGREKWVYNFVIRTPLPSHPTEGSLVILLRREAKPNHLLHGHLLLCKSDEICDKVCALFYMFNVSFSPQELGQLKSPLLRVQLYSPLRINALPFLGVPCLQHPLVQHLSLPTKTPQAAKTMQSMIISWMLKLFLFQDSKTCNGGEIPWGKVEAVAIFSHYVTNVSMREDVP